MRTPLRSASLSLVSLALLCAGLAGAEPPPGEPRPYALRIEGYLGATILDGGSAGTVDAFEGGGAGSLSALLGPATLQIDIFGDFANFDTDANSGGAGGHLGLWRSDYGGLGLTGSYQWQEYPPGQTDRFFRIGGEAEMYVDLLTFGVQGGYFENDDKGDGGFYARGLVRAYPIPDLKLEAVGGYAELEQDSLPQAAFLAEYRPPGWRVSLFARWEATFDNDDLFSFVTFDQHSAVAGLRIYFDSGLSLRETDRVYFRDACTNLNRLSRIC